MKGKEIEAKRDFINRRSAAKSYASNIDTASKHNASVVLEFGSSFIRVGIAGDSTPRHIIPCYVDNVSKPMSPYLPSAPGLPVKTDQVRTASEWEKCLFSFFSNLYTNTLLMKPRSRRIILLMPSSVYYLDIFKNALQTVLLDRLKVPSILFVEGGSLQTIIPYALGRQVGMLIDIGRLEARIVGVFHCPLQDMLQIVPAGMDVLSQCVMDMVPEAKTLEDARALIRSSLTNKASLNNEKTHSVVYDINRLVDDIFFDLSNPNSLIHAFFLSLLKCPLDLRKEMVRNVTIVGGGVSGIPDFEKRFLIAIRDLFEKNDEAYFSFRDPRHGKFQALSVAIMHAPLKVLYPLPFSSSSIGWVGGSIMGILNRPENNWVSMNVV